MIFKATTHAYNTCWIESFSESELWKTEIYISGFRQHYWYSGHWIRNSACSRTIKSHTFEWL